MQIIFTSLNTPNNKEIKNLMIKYMKKRSTQSVWFDVILKHGVKIDTKKYGYIDGTTCVIYDVKNSQTDYQQRSMIYERYLDLCRMKKNNLHRSYRTIMPQPY